LEPIVQIIPQSTTFGVEDLERATSDGIKRVLHVLEQLIGPDDLNVYDGTLKKR